jgi:hypothetical protein
MIQDWERGLYPLADDEVVQPEACLSPEELAAVAEAANMAGYSWNEHSMDGEAIV